MNLFGLILSSFAANSVLAVKEGAETIIYLGDEGYKVNSNHESITNTLKEKKAALTSAQKVKNVVKAFAPGYNLYATGKSVERLKQSPVEEYRKDMGEDALIPLTDEEQTLYDMLKKDGTKTSKLCYLSLISVGESPLPSLIAAKQVEVAIMEQKRKLNEKYENMKGDAFVAYVKGLETYDEVKHKVNETLYDAEELADKAKNKAEEIVLSLKSKRNN